MIKVARNHLVMGPNLEHDIVKSFEGVLKSLVDGETYKKTSPTGPIDLNLPTLSDSELKALTLNESGEDNSHSNYFRSYKKGSLAIVEESPYPKEVALPTSEQLDGINICGIDGSNQKIEKSSFYFILAKAVIVNFKYTSGTEKPYFYRKSRQLSAVTWVDRNIFDKDDIILQTDNSLKKLSSKDDSVNILERVRKGSNTPFLVSYDHTKSNKSPSSHALGWGVKFQQALELLCLDDIDASKKTVCVKDGPLFSTSSSIEDTLMGLNPVFAWDKAVLICVSKRVSESKLLLESLLHIPDLREVYFPDQNIIDDTIRSIGNDVLLLSRMISPGQRTPLIQAVPTARGPIVEEEPRLMPLSCYYLRRAKPHTFIRMEIPKFMWERRREAVEEAIRVVAWQHELGVTAPLVQLMADEQCQLSNEKMILEKQTLAALDRKNLNFIDSYK